MQRKPLVGAEIRRRERPQPAPGPAIEAVPAKPMKRSRHLLDLRDAAPLAPEPAPAPPVVVHDRIAEDAARATPPPPAPEPHPTVQRAVAPTQPVASEPEPPAAEPRYHHPAHPQPAAEPTRRERESSQRTQRASRSVRGNAFGAFSRPQPPRPRRPWTWRRALVLAVRIAITLIGAAGFLMLNQLGLPERLIGIYFVASLVFAIDSQRIFLVALLFLALVAITSAMGKSVPAENYAVYAFYFLVIGLVAAIREQIANRFKAVGGKSQI